MKKTAQAPYFSGNAAYSDSEGKYHVKEEHNIVHKVLLAQKDPSSADALIEQYLPFIRSEAGKLSSPLPSQQEDEISIVCLV